MTDGNVYVIEGLDGSGRATATNNVAHAIGAETLRTPGPVFEGNGQDEGLIDYVHDLGDPGLLFQTYMAANKLVSNTLEELRYAGGSAAAVDTDEPFDDLFAHVADYGDETLEELLDDTYEAAQELQVDHVPDQPIDVVVNQYVGATLAQTNAALAMIDDEDRADKGLPDQFNDQVATYDLSPATMTFFLNVPKSERMRRLQAHAEHDDTKPAEEIRDEQYMNIARDQYGTLVGELGMNVVDANPDIDDLDRSAIIVRNRILEQAGSGPWG